jgi:hypothetical protein
VEHLMAVTISEKKLSERGRPPIERIALVLQRLTSSDGIRTFDIPATRACNPSKNCPHARSSARTPFRSAEAGGSGRQRPIKIGN